MFNQISCIRIKKNLIVKIKLFPIWFGIKKSKGKHKERNVYL